MQQRNIIVAIVIFIVISIVFCAFLILPLFVSQANQWAYEAVQIDKLHDLGYDGSGVTIGIIDTGVDRSHQEFDSTSFTAWHDFINFNSQWYDDDDHGTHLAGLLVSKGSFSGLFSGVNLQGIVPASKLVVVKAIPRNLYLYGGGNDTTIANAINYCIEQEVDIILLSLGLSPEDVTFSDVNLTCSAIDTAINQGIFVVASSGNDGESDDGDVCFPSSIDYVISVGSFSKSSTVSSFSSKGHQYPSTVNPHKKPELLAPGEDIISSRVNGAYGTLSGTSQAATILTGGLALLLDAYPDYKHNGDKNLNITTVSFLKQILASTALKIGSLEGNNEIYSHDDSYGYGLVQFHEAYKELAKY